MIARGARTLGPMLLVSAVIALHGAKASAQARQMQMLPPIIRRDCGGVQPQDLDNAYQAALAVVRARKLDEMKFEAQISHKCPRRDMEYFRRVMNL